MVDLFRDHVIVKNNSKREEYDTDHEVNLRLRNKIIMLLFASADCKQCLDFAPTMKEFFTHLIDEFYVDRASQLAMIFVSLDDSEEKMDEYLNKLPKKCLFLNHDDPFRRKLETMFDVKEHPTVVVLRPDCSVISTNAVQEINDLGVDCFQNWHEGTEIINRNFLLNEEYTKKTWHTATDYVRQHKYREEEYEERKMKRKKGFLF